LAQDRKDLGFAVSRHLHLNLLMHLAEKILLMQPLTFGGDYPLDLDNTRRSWRYRAREALRTIPRV
jgi:hypothetical protein